MQKKIGELVVADMKERIKLGKKKYGVFLTTNNGRNALQDAYEEALDLCMYLRQKIEEESIIRDNGDKHDDVIWEQTRKEPGL